MHERFFLDVRNQLYNGDTIKICQYDAVSNDRRAVKLVAWAHVIVYGVEMRPPSVKFAVMAPGITYVADLADEPVTDAALHHAPKAAARKVNGPLAHSPA